MRPTQITRVRRKRLSKDRSEIVRSSILPTKQNSLTTLPVLDRAKVLRNDEIADGRSANSAKGEAILCTDLVSDLLTSIRQCLLTSFARTDAATM